MKYIEKLVKSNSNLSKESESDLSSFNDIVQFYKILVNKTRNKYGLMHEDENENDEVYSSFP